MNLQELYENYQGKRKTVMEKDDFTNLLIMYPAALVANCDNNFDKLEKENLYESVKEASGDNALLACEMYSELTYLLSDHSMHNEISSCIKSEAANNQNVKTIINDLMNSVAESSEGISMEEKNKIDELKTELGTI